MSASLQRLAHSTRQLAYPAQRLGRGGARAEQLRDLATAAAGAHVDEQRLHHDVKCGVRAEGALDGAEQLALVLRLEALALGYRKPRKVALAVGNRQHRDTAERGSHLDKGEDLADAPEALDVGGAGDDEQRLAAREEDGQARERRIDVLLIYARLPPNDASWRAVGA